MTKTMPLNFKRLPAETMRQTSSDFYELLNRRRTVREFSPEAVPEEVIMNCIKAAGTAPSGANQQPWHFVAIKNPDIKKKIRLAAEEEERKFYNDRAPEEWLKALEHLGTDDQKPFLEVAPWLIPVFVEKHRVGPEGEVLKNYYTMESVGLATGMLLAALHSAGLATLTHTPSPMRFLSEICGRPANEKPFVLIVCGYPTDGVRVPDICRKSLDEISTVL
jgi:iodotyrosine deiodinase